MSREVCGRTTESRAGSKRWRSSQIICRGVQALAVMAALNAIGCELEPLALPEPCLRFDTSEDDPEARLKIAGSIDGEEFHTRHRHFIVGSSTGKTNLFFTTLGRIVLSPEDSTAQGEAVAASGLLRMPAEGPSPLDVFCVGTGTVLAPPGPASYSLRSLRTLGECPGTPVEGQVSISLKFAEGSPIESTIPGAEFKWSDQVASAGPFQMDNTGERAWNIDLSNDGVLIVDLYNGAVDGALLMIASSSPDAGAVYCAGSGSVLQDSGNVTPTKIVLNDLSRLGTCATAEPIDGEVDVCW